MVLCGICDKVCDLDAILSIKCDDVGPNGIDMKNVCKHFIDRFVL